MHAKANVSEQKPPFDHDSPFAFSMEGYHGIPPSTVIPLFWTPGWNSIQSVNKFQTEVGGALLDGDPGLPLIHPVAEKTAYYKEVPAEFTAQAGKWLMIPLTHIFGSEELSRESKSIMQRTPLPYILMNGMEGKKLHIKENDNILLQVNSLHLEFKVRFSETLPRGVIGYPAGLKNMPNLELPTWGILAGVRE